MTTKIKICGITSLQDAEAAAFSRADYIGLIFVQESPRLVSYPVAQNIIEAVRGECQVVGVFMDHPVDFVRYTFDHLELDLAQYHGSETPDYLREVGVPAIKAFNLSPDFDWGQTSAYAGVVQSLLFDQDKQDPNPDWLSWALTFLAQTPKDVPDFFLAGGLNAQNVGQAVQQLRPFGVDVASGVERAPGVKDHLQIQEFCSAVREASRT